MYDAVVVGSGPNGLAAAITIARAGRSVCVLEAAETAGGGMRTAELTLPGFHHDICSAVHPLGVGSPFFRRLPLSQHGLEWVHAKAPLAHPLDDAPAAVLHGSLEAMAREYPRDARAYGALMAPLVERWDALASESLRPILHLPRHPLLLARFGLPSLLSAERLARWKFQEPRLRALFAGLAAHAILPLDARFTASFGVVLAAVAHACGWPVAKGGSGAIAAALLSYLRSLGGEVRTGSPVRSLADLPPHRVVLFDVGPEQLLEICGHAISGRYRRQLVAFKRGEAVFKVDYALSAPVPWRDPALRDAGTVHLGGHLEEIVAAEGLVGSGRIPERPMVLTAQPSVADPGRAPEGKHTFWAYCHLPRGSNVDMTSAIEAQVERFAPGFRDVVLARATWSPHDLEAHNANLRGGDITGGSNGGWQLFFRPAVRLNPYATPMEGVYICSASTPPGGGVHGMSGYWAARSALRRHLR